VASRSTFTSSAVSLGPGLVNLLRTPHLLTDPIRERMEDLLDLEVSEGGRVEILWAPDLGRMVEMEGKGAISCCLSRSSKTLLSGGRDFFS